MAQILHTNIYRPTESLNWLPPLSCIYYWRDGCNSFDNVCASVCPCHSTGRTDRDTDLKNVLQLLYIIAHEIIISNSVQTDETSPLFLYRPIKLATYSFGMEVKCSVENSHPPVAWGYLALGLSNLAPQVGSPGWQPKIAISHLLDAPQQSTPLFLMYPYSSVKRFNLFGLLEKRLSAKFYIKKLIIICIICISIQGITK